MARPRRHGSQGHLAIEVLGAYLLKGRALQLTEFNNDRDLARTSLLLSPFFQAFDPIQFESYLSNGLTPVDPADPDGAVTLAFPRWAEALVFSESNAMGEVWDRLKFGGKVSNACEDVRWVLPGKGEV